MEKAKFIVKIADGFELPKIDTSFSKNQMKYQKKGLPKKVAAYIDNLPLPNYDLPILERKDGKIYISHDEGILILNQDEYFPDFPFDRLCKVHKISFTKWENANLKTMKSLFDKFSEILPNREYHFEQQEVMFNLLFTGRIPDDIKNLNDKNTYIKKVEMQILNLKSQLNNPYLEKEIKREIKYRIGFNENYKAQIELYEIPQPDPTPESKKDSRKLNDLSQPQICALIWFLTVHEKKYEITYLQGMGTVLDVIDKVIIDFGFKGSRKSIEKKFSDIRYILDNKQYSEIQYVLKAIEPYLKDFPTALNELQKHLKEA